MHTLEITIQRRLGDAWPVVAQRFTSGEAAPTRREGVLGLDLEELNRSGPSESGETMGRAVFHDEVLRTFNECLALSATDHLHVLLHVEDRELRKERWERLAAPLDGRWVSLAVNQRTPYSLHLPSATDRRFPPISRHDLRALIVVANPTRPESWRLPAFDATAIVAETRKALGSIPSDTLCEGVERALGHPTLDAIAKALTENSYTILHIVAHGRLVKNQDGVEPVLYLANASGEVDPVLAGRFIAGLGLLRPARGLPHFAFLGTCESAAPEAEGVFGGLGQRLVRELGMPAVLAMTDSISVASASALASEFYKRLRVHGEVDSALAEACAGIARRSDIAVPVPALFSRLTGQPLFSLAPDGRLSPGEILHGLDRLDALLNERAPALRLDFEGPARTLRGLAKVDSLQLGRERRREWDDSLAGVDNLCQEVLELSFEALANDMEPRPYDPRCPFKGLESFKPADRAFFFARETWVERLKERLGRHPFLAVLGPSGSGKSSLVLAGLLPVLFDREPGLRAAVLTPGSEPCARLQEALAAVGEEHAVVVIDQFEEVFTLCTAADQRETFFHRVLDLTASRRVILTMRADFWGDCASHSALRERMRDNQELIPPMTLEELRQAMTAQAKAVGLEFELGLDGTILADVEGEPGAMPLLQHALLELWNHRHGRRLTAGEYQTIGRVQGAIAKTANHAYETLFQPSEQGRVRDLFLRLVHVDESGDLPRDTRKRVRLEGLVPGDSDLARTRSLVERLANRRLVVTSPRGEERLTEVEVAHEALIRHWDRLKRWLDENRVVLRLRQGIEEAANGWERAGRDEYYLIHKGSRLLDAERIRDDPRFGVFGLEREYVDACVALREKERVEEERRRAELEHQRQQKMRILQVGLAVATILLVAVYLSYLKQTSLTHNLRVALVKDQISTGLERFKGSREDVDLVAGKIKELAQLEPGEVAEQQKALGNHLIEAVRKMVRQESALSAENIEKIRETIALAKDYAPSDIPELEKSLEERIAKPDQAFSFADSLNEFASVFESGLVRVSGRGLIAGVNAPPGGDGLIPTKIPCQGDSEIEGKFTLESDATAGARFGLALNGGEGRGYLFTLTGRPGSGSVRTDPAASSPPRRRMLMTIQRNKVVLRETEVELSDTTVALFAQKKGDTLSFTVGKTTLNFDDIFPLSTGNPGVFGIVLPGGVRLDGLAARKKRLPDSPSPLEKGVALFNGGDFEKAMSEFDRVENTTESVEIKSEAGYRKALCMVERKREADAKPVFERLAASQGPFQTRAACQVWKILLRSAKVSDIEQADKIFDNLSANVDYTDLALVLSEEERNEILSFYRQVGFFARIFYAPTRVRNLERALKIEELIKADSATRQRTLWRLADAFRLDERDSDAVRTIENLLSAKDLLPDDRIGITRDYAWLMITGGTPAKALEEINRRLGPDPPGSDDLNFPMLVERARVHAALRNWDQAEADVVRFIELVRKPSISYSDFAEACLFRGFLLERRGLKDEAVKVWRAGLRKNWLKDHPVISAPNRLLDGKPLRDDWRSLVHFGMLASLTQELGDDECRAVSKEVMGTGDFTSASIVKFFDLFRNYTLLSPEHIQAIIKEIYNESTGHEFARREAYL
ncbi:MAG: CHAT domain-containing protein, partial [Candidatus Limnocylindrales bacterium]